MILLLFFFKRKIGKWKIDTSIIGFKIFFINLGFWEMNFSEFVYRKMLLKLSTNYYHQNFQF